MFYTQQHNIINGHGVWHYLVSTPIGDIHIVEWEGKGMELDRVIIYADNEKAERKFNAVCKAMLSGKMF